MENTSFHSRFREVSKQRLARLRMGMASLGTERGEIAEISREIHTLKGEARILGIQAVATLAERTEELMKLAGQGAGESAARVHEEIVRGLDTIESSLREDAESSSKIDAVELTFRVDALLAEERTLGDATSSQKPALAQEGAATATGDRPHRSLEQGNGEHMTKRHILVVDDSELTLDFVREGLEQRGYRVTTLDNPIEMSAVIRQNRPDAIVLDVNMPLLSGDKVIEILKKYRFSGGIPVILFSDLDQDELEAMAQRTEAAGSIKKSGDLAPLAAEIERALGSGGGSRDTLG